MALSMLVAVLAAHAVAADSSPAAEGRCAFATEQDVPSYWEPRCTLDMPGCWADSAHVECRFCGGAPYTGIPCPDQETGQGAQAAMGAEGTQDADRQKEAAEVEAPGLAGGFLAANVELQQQPAADQPTCTFANPPLTPFYWEPACYVGMVGCLADNVHVQCRFCGMGGYASIPCSTTPLPPTLPLQCTFPNPPRTPYFWDQNCTLSTAGCNADGIHVQCRFCVQRPFNAVQCPESVRVPPGACSFPGLLPATPHFWDATCHFGMLGCWADGLHAECRWCGAGAYASVPCPP